MRNLKVVFALTVVASLLIVSTSEAKRFTDSPNSTNANAPTLVHDPANGNLSMNSDPMITTWEMKSDGGNFNCDAINPESLDPFFGTCSADKIFTTWPSGSGALDFGNVWGDKGYALLLTDLDQDGSLVGGGGLDREDAQAPYAHNVPEPASVTLLGLGLLGLMGLRRKNK